MLECSRYEAHVRLDLGDPFLVLAAQRGVEVRRATCTIGMRVSMHVNEILGGPGPQVRVHGLPCLHDLDLILELSFGLEVRHKSLAGGHSVGAAEVVVIGK